MNDTAEQISRLRCILDVTREMALTTDLDALLQRIISAACRVLSCARATVFLYDPQRHEFTSRVATNVESIRFSADLGIAGAAASQHRIINVPDAYADPRFNRAVDQETGFRTRSLLTVPLESLDHKLMGVLQALNKEGGAFVEQDEKMAELLAAQAGVALQRWRLLQEYADKQRIARDLEIARRIQQNLLPAQQPTVEGYRIAGWNRSADETGGDCYDFIPLADGRLAVLLADATGHGIGAALIIAQCRSLTRAMLSMTSDLRVLAERVNRLLAEDLTGDRFVTAFLGILDPVTHVLEFVSAGQGPLLLVTPAGTEIQNATGPPLAVLPDTDYEISRITFAPGTALVLLTDGFYEARDPADEEFGCERVVRHIQAEQHQPPTRVIQTLHEKIREFCGANPQADDLTAVIVRRESDRAAAGC